MTEDLARTTVARYGVTATPDGDADQMVVVRSRTCYTIRCGADPGCRWWARHGAPEPHYGSHGDAVAAAAGLVAAGWRPVGDVLVCPVHAGLNGLVACPGCGTRHHPGLACPLPDPDDDERPRTPVTTIDTRDLL